MKSPEKSRKVLKSQEQSLYFSRFVYGSLKTFHIALAVQPHKQAFLQDLHCMETLLQDLHRMEALFIAGPAHISYAALLQVLH